MKLNIKATQRGSFLYFMKFLQNQVNMLIVTNIEEAYLLETFVKENFITIITLLAFLIVAFPFYKEFMRKIKNEPFKEYPQPQFISSLGILGTFLGITLGLLPFDSSDLQKSIPTLLDGMKTAFTTSILGLIVSLYMKYCQNKLQENQNTESETFKGTTLDDILSHLIKIHKYTEQKDKLEYELIFSNNEILKDTIKISLEKMTNSLIGDGESTLVGQMKFLRSDVNDTQKSLREEIKKGNDALIEEFKSFAEQMAENNSKAFIEALNQSMRDLNNQLQEQFGENFKQLNIAVGKLLDWQENYKNTIIEVTENQKIIFARINNAKTALEEMALNSVLIQESAEKLSDITVTTASYNKVIQEALEKLGNISQQANEFIPSLHRSMDTMNENIEKAVKNTSNQILKVNEILLENSKQIQDNSVVATEYSKELLTATQNYCLKSIDTIEKQAQTITDSITQFSLENVENATKQINAIKAASDRLETSALDVTKRISDNIHSMVETNNENLKTSMENINNSLEVALNDSLKTLGHQLGSISQKFARDYIPLADKLKEIIEIANKVK